MQKGRPIAAILTVLVVFLGAFDCEAGPPKPAEEKAEEGKPVYQSCESHVQGMNWKAREPLTPYYHRENGQEFIIGRVISNCDKTPTLHTVEIRLQREVKGVWSDQQMVFAGGGSEICNTLPQPGKSVKCERKHPGCFSGRWRVWFSVMWAGDSNGLGPKSGTFVPNDGELPIMTIRCPGPR